MKRDKGPHNEKYRVEYHINNNSTDVLNMMDGLSMEPEKEEEGDRCVYINPRSVVIAESTWTDRIKDFILRDHYEIQSLSKLGCPKLRKDRGGVRASKDHAHPYTTSLDKYDYNKTEHKAGNTAEGSLTDLALNKSAHCRIATLAFSFVLIPTSRNVWH